MGFFSYLCRECGHPMLCSQAASPGINNWMTQVVAVYPNGTKIVGSYDGYGRVDGNEVDSEGDLAWHHVSCYEKAESPSYNGASLLAPDQGWFFDVRAHDLQDPLHPVPDEVWAARLQARADRYAELEAEDREYEAEIAEALALPSNLE